MHVNEQSISTSLADLSCTEAFHLINSEMRRVDFGNMRNGNRVALKRLEMRLDYHKVSQSLNLRSLKKEKPEGVTPAEVERLHRQRVMAECKNWAEYLLQEKTRQMQVEDMSVWPPLPWEVEDVLTMPVVIWVNYKKQSVRA